MTEILSDGILALMIGLISIVSLVVPNTVGSFSGVPGFVGTIGVDLELRTHAVSAEVLQRGQTVRSVSQIKNHSKEGGEITVLIPSNARTALGDLALRGILGSLRVYWDGQQVPAQVDAGSIEFVGDRPVDIDGQITAKVVIKSEGTHNLTIEYKSELASTFSADLQTFAYDIRFVNSWKDRKIGQLSVALRYAQLPNGQSAVFYVDSTYPRGWQAGNGIGPGQQGAYFGARDFQAAERVSDRRPILFTYYAGGF